MQARMVRRLSLLAFIAGVLAVQLARPEPSRAGAVLRWFELTPGAPLCTGITLCSPTEPCTDMRTTCEAIDGLGENCVEPAQDLYCCASATCPPIAGVSASCVPVDNTETAARLDLCVYPHFSLCDASLTLDRVRACFTGVGGGFVTHWADGNCDADRLPNGSDPDPCTPEAVVPEDGGGLPGDGGVVGLDAGSGTRDAGPRRDAGARRDGGSAGTDGSTRAPISFRGGGGCVCSTPGARAAAR